MERDKAARLIRPPLEIPPGMTPSPTMQVHFSDGTVAMNRAERRRQHLYGGRLKRMPRRGPPPGFENIKHNA